MYINKTAYKVQPKLTIGQPNDRFEQEADRVADRVMKKSTTTDSQIQRKCAECEEEEEGLQMKPLSATITPIVQKKEEEEEEGLLQMKGSGHGSSGMEGLQASLQQSKGGGSHMDSSTTSFMSNNIGADFSNVKIHTDKNAVQMNQQLNAKAFTNGSDIYFNQGQYNPKSTEGKHLLAHELTHVVQQNSHGDMINKMSVTRHGALHRGPCGERGIAWIFALDNPAPEDGYIVQQVDMYVDIQDCPTIGKCPASPTQTFWEAWWVNSGDTNEHIGTPQYTDRSGRPSAPNTSGESVALGTIKFFPISVTGDLGNFDTPPADSSSPWRPGRAGGVRMSGGLPSVADQPSWWSSTPTEGPVTRRASSGWSCCGPESDHFSNVSSDP